MEKQALTWVTCTTAVIGFLAMAQGAARAGEPYVGVDLGVAAPLQKFRRTADVGGAIIGHAGYRLFTIADSVSLSIEGVPQFAAMPIKGGVSTKGRDVQSLFSITGGPKIAIQNEALEVSFSAGGGYYTHTSGVVDDDGTGWFFAGGLQYRVDAVNQVGLFARRDSADMRPVKGPNDYDTTYFTGGLSFTHFFTCTEKVAEAAPPQPVPAVAAPAPPAVKKKLVLRGVNFDFDKSNIRADAAPILNEAAATLQSESQAAVSVEGHTDAVGSDAYNQKLSERRAHAVAEYLATHGVERSRLSTVGYGESKPVATNDSADGRAENRRVELRVNGE